MRQLQELGHQVIFLIGDFTSMIGDPSGRNTTRPPLTREQIEANAQTYYRQASLVLDPARTEIRYNSEWSDPLGARGMIELASRYTVARMMERNDFSERFRAGTPISVHEFLYPLMQGYDSVALHSRTSNSAAPTRSSTCWSAGHCRSKYGQEPQCILTMPLLEGLDGVEKMSKSKGNYIGITEPANSMFAKLLSISDTLMWRYFALLSLRPRRRGRGFRREVGRGPQPEGDQGRAGDGDHDALPWCGSGRGRGTRFRTARARRHPDVIARSRFDGRADRHRRAAASRPRLRPRAARRTG